MNEGNRVLDQARSALASSKQLLADTKVRYTEVGATSVDPAVLEAALRAQKLFSWWAGPGLGGIEIVWIREETAEERAYFERWPADRGDPDFDDTCIEKDLDEPIIGQAGMPGDDLIFIHADLDAEQVVKVVAHELEHKRQSPDLSKEEREKDARTVSAAFVAKFYPRADIPVYPSWLLGQVIRR